MYTYTIRVLYIPRTTWKKQAGAAAAAATALAAQKLVSQSSGREYEYPMRVDLWYVFMPSYIKHKHQ